jgi:hypothetical protein
VGRKRAAVGARGGTPDPRRGSEVRVSAKDWGEPVPEIERLRAAGCEISTAATGMAAFVYLPTDSKDFPAAQTP